MEESPVKKDVEKESDVNQKNIVKDSEAKDSNNKRKASDDFENKSNSEVLPQYCDKNAIKGKAVFVVNKFEKTQMERKGAERDIKLLKDIFIDKLGFEQLNINKDLNLSRKKLDDVLEEMSNMDYTDTDIFVFAISTHGEERPNKTDEYEHALMCEDETYVFTSDIIHKFCCKHSLDGKPKLFFIQACRIPYDTDSEKDANIYDPGHKILIKEANEEKKEEVLPERGKEEQRQETENYQTKQKYLQENADAGHRKEEEVENQQCPGAQGQSSFPLFSSISCPKDCLVVYAIQSGKLAWRSEGTGSWMFHELSEVIKRYDKSSHMDFFEILTKAAFGMAQRESSTKAEISCGKKSVPVIQHRLIKGLLIPLVKRV